MHPIIGNHPHRIAYPDPGKGIDIRIHSAVKLPSITIDGEHETNRGWLYTFTTNWRDGSSSDHEITLSWVDHEHLVGGTISPSVIAQAVAEIMLEEFNQKNMPIKSDVSSLSRLIPNFEQRIHAQ